MPFMPSSSLCLGMQQPHWDIFGIILITALMPLSSNDKFGPADFIQTNQIPISRSPASYMNYHSTLIYSVTTLGHKRIWLPHHARALTAGFLYASRISFPDHEFRIRSIERGTSYISARVSCSIPEAPDVRQAQASLTSYLYLRSLISSHSFVDGLAA